MSSVIRKNKWATQTPMQNNPPQGGKTQRIDKASPTNLIATLVQQIKTLEARSAEQN